VLSSQSSVIVVSLLANKEGDRKTGDRTQGHQAVDADDDGPLTRRSCIKMLSEVWLLVHAKS
jgi:hypothetical protein